MKVTLQSGASNVTVSTASQKDLAETILTEEEKAQAIAGTHITIRLNVTNTTASISSANQASVLAALKELGPQFKVGEYLDVTLEKSVGSHEPALIHNTGRVMVTLVFTVPEALRTPDRIFRIIQLHNGSSSVLHDLDGNENTITVQNNLFSVYAIVYADEDSTPTSVITAIASSPPAATLIPPMTERPVATETPDTADNAPVPAYGILLGLSALGLAAIILIRKGGRRNRN